MIEANAYSTPFEPVCAICNSLASASALIKNAMLDCVRRNQRCHFIYKHCLSFVIGTIDKNNVQCTTRQPILYELLHGLTEMQYEIYLQKKPKTIYMLHDFRVHVKFTLNEDSVVLHVG
jgi:hypothetical protein